MGPQSPDTYPPDLLDSASTMGILLPYKPGKLSLLLLHSQDRTALHA